MPSQTKPFSALLVGACLLSGVLGACGPLGGQSRDSGERSVGTTCVVTADWNDVAAAVEAAAGQSEMVVLNAAPADTETAFELVASGDEPVSVVCRRAGATPTPGGDGPAEAVTIRVRVGEFGDRPREQRLVARIRARLIDLVGKDWAPMRN